MEPVACLTHSSLNRTHFLSLRRAGAIGAAGTAMAVPVFDGEKMGVAGVKYHDLCARTLQAQLASYFLYWVSIAGSIKIIHVGGSRDCCERNGDEANARVI